MGNTPTRELTVYHRTSRKNVESIKKYGILRSKSQTWQGKGGCIYLSRNPDTNFGEVLLEVKLHVDEPSECYDLSDWEIICFHDIRPEDIRVLD